MFPAQDTYMEWLKVKYSPNTQIIDVEVLTDFFSYVADQHIGESRNVSSVTESDIRSYLDNLQSKRKFAPRTINKYLTTLHRYFRFLTANGVLKIDPSYSVKGLKFNRKKRIVINWYPHIRKIIRSGSVSPDTIKLMVVIGVGGTPQNYLEFQWNDIESKVNNKVIKRYIENHVDFSKTANPIIFQDKKGNAITTNEAILAKTKGDRSTLNMPLSPTDLRLGYIYSIVNKPNQTDEKLMKRLQCSLSSLIYYKKNALSYELVDFENIWPK
ncbi:hypothetical protein FOD75_10950 (plasmid) [Limosilactobacillus reuteri]|uniref:Core-binding (CB) domain-containing protein n=1 Tax=Limosilactobacillus reuteri TaxID=1598 RepID=A0A517D8J6_LIMRT|nr:site-specific integrase [Limosilactobacillus reuteri]QDR73607.1 hypothetical protein FOD75_10950 [Limosilactobacillus reuteri]